MTVCHQIFIILTNTMRSLELFRMHSTWQFVLGLLNIWVMFGQQTRDSTVMRCHLSFHREETMLSYCCIGHWFSQPIVIASLPQSTDLFFWFVWRLCCGII